MILKLLLIVMLVIPLGYLATVLFMDLWNQLMKHMKNGGSNHGNNKQR